MGQDAEQRRGAEQILVGQILGAGAQKGQLVDGLADGVGAKQAGDVLGQLIPRLVAGGQVGERLLARQKAPRIGEGTEVVVPQRFIGRLGLFNYAPGRRE